MVELKNNAHNTFHIMNTPHKEEEVDSSDWDDEEVAPASARNDDEILLKSGDDEENDQNSDEEDDDFLVDAPAIDIGRSALSDALSDNDERPEGAPKDAKKKKKLGKDKGKKKKRTKKKKEGEAVQGKRKAEAMDEDEEVEAVEEEAGAAGAAGGGKKVSFMMQKKRIVEDVITLNEGAPPGLVVVKVSGKLVWLTVNFKNVHNVMSVAAVRAMLRGAANMEIGSHTLPTEEDERMVRRAFGVGLPSQLIESIARNIKSKSIRDKKVTVSTPPKMVSAEPSVVDEVQRTKRQRLVNSPTVSINFACAPSEVRETLQRLMQSFD